MKEMSFIEHLDELRTRVIRVFIILIVSFCLCYYFSSNIQEFLLVPLRRAIGHGGKVIFTGLLDKVMAEFQIGFWSSVFFASPLWFREAWLFIKPGLYEKEIRAIRPFIFVGFFLFISGAAFGYYVLFPFTFNTLLTAGVKDVEAMLNLQDYLMLASKILVFLGLLFQLPNVIVILGFMGIVTKYSLRNMRRYLAVFFAVAAAIITPTPDILSMMCVWIPMMVLYEIGILAVTFIVHPHLERRYIDENEEPSSHSDTVKGAGLGSASDPEVIAMLEDHHGPVQEASSESEPEPQSETETESKSGPEESDTPLSSAEDPELRAFYDSMESDLESAEDEEDDTDPDKKSE